MAVAEDYSRQTYSYWALRKAVGWIGILLPFALMVGYLLLFDGGLVQESISYYYHTEMRNVLVGALCAVALFLFFYCGYDKWDNWVGNMAGLFAVGVAWFPTAKVGPSDTAGLVHFVCATLFFSALTFFSLFLFTKKDKQPSPRKLIRNKIHVVCGLIMIGCLVSIAVYYNFIHGPDSASSFVFIAETVALVSFGVSWLTKGGSILPDPDESQEPKVVEEREDNPMTKEEVEQERQFYWDWLKHEENIVTNRSNFFLVAEAMFVAAVATLWSQSENASQLATLSTCIAALLITSAWLFVNVKHIEHTGHKIREKLKELDPRVKEIRDYKGIWNLRAFKLIGYGVTGILLLLWIVWGTWILSH